MGAFGDDDLGRRLAQLTAPSDSDERVVSTEPVADAGFMSWQRLRVRSDEGAEHTRFAVMHPGAVAILALSAAHLEAIDVATPLWLVRQMRSVPGRVLLEIPAGTLERAAGGTELPAEAAARELDEETGLRATSWQHLRTFYTAPGFTDERMELFLALGLSPAGAGRRAHDVDERLEAVSLTVAEALEAVRRGAIVDAKSLVAVGIAGELARTGTTG